MKTRKRVLLSSRGSLIGGLFALGVMGVSTMGLVHYMQNFKKTMKSTILQVNYQPALRMVILDNLRSLLIEKKISQTGEASQRNEFGICSLVKNPQKSSGVESLRLNFLRMNADNSNWGESRWKVFFPQSEWKLLIDTSHCKKIDTSFSVNSKFRRCLKYLGEQGSTRTSQPAYVIAEIIPRKFPSLDIIDTTKDESLDPKQVFFELKTQITGIGSNFVSSSANNDEQDGKKGSSATEELPYVSSQSDIMWANSVGECHVRNQGGNWVVVQFSGTGTGKQLSQNVINSSLMEENTCNDFSISGLNADVVQVGQIDGRGVLSSVSALNAKVSCTSHEFRCRSSSLSGLRGTFDPLEFSFGVFNRSGSQKKIKKISINLVKKDGQIYGINMQNASPSVSQDRSEDSAIPANKNLRTERYLYNGGDRFKVTTEQSGTSLTGRPKGNWAVQNLCSAICSKGKDSQAYPFVGVQLSDGSSFSSCKIQKIFNGPEDKVSCTVCHTKSCHRLGLGTFGPLFTKERSVSVGGQAPQTTRIYGLFDEALDSQIPECGANPSVGYYGTSTKGYKTRFRFPRNAENPLGEPPCIAMKIVNEKSFQNFAENTFQAESCDQKLPVLCFFNGNYIPAFKVNTRNLNAAPTIVRTTFENAENACYEMGREIGNWESLKNYFAKMYSADPDRVQASANRADDGNKFFASKAKNKYNFINNATRGMFFAPSNYNVSFLSERVSSYIQKALNVGAGKIWVALERDAGGRVASSVPWASVAQENPYALFFNKDATPGNPSGVRLLNVLQDTSNPTRVPLPLATNRNCNSQWAWFFGGRRNCNSQFGNNLWGTNTVLDTTSASNYFALAHSIRWKGLVPMHYNAILPYLCKDMSEGTFETTGNKKGNVNGGRKACEDKGNGWAFLPPLSTMEWANAMLEVAKNDAFYPFPNPIAATTTTPIWSSPFWKNRAVPNPKVWVALKKTGDAHKATSRTGPRLKDLRLYNNFPSTTSIFNESVTVPTPDDGHKFLLEKNGTYESLSSEQVAEKKSDSNNKYRILCVNNATGILQSNATEVGVSQSCGQGSSRLTRAHLLAKKSSLRFVLEWVSRLSNDRYYILEN